MKKFLLMIVPLLLGACNQTEDPAVPVEKTTKSHQNRSESEILRIAEAASRIKGNEARSETFAIDQTSLKAITKKFGRSDNADTLIYAVNFKNDKGFVLISAKEGVTPIIGIADEGAYDSFETASNPNFQFFLDNALCFIKDEAEALAADNAAFVFGYDTIKEYKRYPERLKTKWNQNWPENIYCPNKIAGCGPVALSQILAYFEEPKELE